MANTQNTRAEYIASLPRKRMAAGMLFLDPEGRVLIVKPTYREGWLIPGGAVEADEPPSMTCRREVQEELGIDAVPGRLLCVEYLSAYDGYTESMQFIFDGGVLNPITIEQFRLPDAELSGASMAAVDDALRLLNPTLSIRVAYALDALRTGCVHYLEDGQPVGASI